MSGDPDLVSLYAHMLRSRLFEEATATLWRKGLISGEMHLGTGEEAVVAGVVSNLAHGDAMALDHRGTAPLLVRGTDPVALLRELLGRDDGLCRGMGGHMHLYDPDLLAASSGIVGASGPAAVGFAVAGQALRPSSIAVAFFGEGALNQGMLLESFNMASAWKLPVIFVCKNDNWAITTPSASVTGGSPIDRAGGFGLRVFDVEGWDVESVWSASREAIDRARHGGGPSFIHARCVHTEGHFLGDPLLSIVRRPLSALAEMSGPMLRSSTRSSGAPVADRVRQARRLVRSVVDSRRDRTDPDRDPLEVARKRLEASGREVEDLEAELAQEVAGIVERALSH